MAAYLPFFGKGFDTDIAIRGDQPYGRRFVSRDYLSASAMIVAASIGSKYPISTAVSAEAFTALI